MLFIAVAGLLGLEACATVRRCVGASLILETGVCYLKAIHGPPQNNGVQVWAARLHEEAAPQDNPDPPSVFKPRVLEDGTQTQRLADVIADVMARAVIEQAESRKVRYYENFVVSERRKAALAKREGKVYDDQTAIAKFAKELWGHGTTTAETDLEDGENRGAQTVVSRVGEGEGEARNDVPPGLVEVVSSQAKEEVGGDEMVRLGQHHVEVEEHVVEAPLKIDVVVGIDAPEPTEKVAKRTTEVS